MTFRRQTGWSWCAGARMSLPNVDVVPGGDYIISRATFPAYFLQGDPEQARCDLELTLFGKRIAPALGITRRFVGQEPYSPVTARYNRRMQALLPRWGISVTEIPRLEGISASRVRAAAAPGPPGRYPTSGTGDNLCIL